MHSTIAFISAFSAILVGAQNWTCGATLASILQHMAEKTEAGFIMGVAGFIGRVIGFEFIKDSETASSRLSGIKELAKFKIYQMPTEADR